MILAARAMILLLVSAALVTATVRLRRRPPLDSAAQAVYTCPMHPEITARGPGQCPICRMALEPARRGTSSAKAGPPSGAVADPDRFTVAPAAQDRLFADIMGVRSRPVSRAVLAPAWVEAPGRVAAHLYRDEMALLDAGEEAVFVGGGQETRLRLTEDRPADWDEATAVVRLSSPGRTPAAGTVGWIRFPPRARTMLAVPYSAVLQGPEGPYVLVASVDRHTFSKRSVRIGRVVYGYAPVLSGLTAGERVAVMETFFIDAERRLGQADPAGAARAGR
jgi:hypothetical protein